MPGVLNVATIEQLKPFLDKNNIIEIAMRGRKAKFKAFQKISLGDFVQESQKQEAMQKAFKQLDKIAKIDMKNAKILNDVAKLNKINMVLNGLNLCATCAGFAIMYMKLDKMSGQINKVLSVVKKGQDIQANYEFKKVLSTHSDMLDHRKTQQYYSESQMRELVDSEYNVLDMLTQVFKKEVSEDTETLIYSIISLAQMLSVSLRYFDEVYYFNNKDIISGDDVWHASHPNWLKIYDTLTSNAFVRQLQDYAVLNAHVNMRECDAYCISIVDEFKRAKKAIEDNQELIKTFDDQELLGVFNNYNNQFIKETIEDAFKDLKKDDEIQKTINKAMKQVGISY